jgi:hypothetical protein
MTTGQPRAAQAAVQESAAAVRAYEVEEQMIDDERFSLLVSAVGESPWAGILRGEASW